MKAPLCSIFVVILLVSMFHPGVANPSTYSLYNRLLNKMYDGIEVMNERAERLVANLVGGKYDEGLSGGISLI